jgi:hypothetical protein
MDELIRLVTSRPLFISALNAKIRVSMEAVSNYDGVGCYNWLWVRFERKDKAIEKIFDLAVYDRMMIPVQAIDDKLREMLRAVEEPIDARGVFK